MADTFGDFLNEVGRYPLLIPSQEIELSRQIKAMIELRDREDKTYTKKEQRTIAIGRRARQKLIRHNLRLVIYIARRFANASKVESLEMQDLVQEGVIGLTRATEIFDGTKGYKFATYAFWWIKQAIRRAIDNQARVMRLPAHANERIYAIRKYTDQYYAETGTYPSIEQICEKVKLTSETVRLYLERSAPVASLDVTRGKDNDLDFTSCIADPNTVGENDAYSAIDEEVEYSELQICLEALSEREREVVLMRYGIGPYARQATLNEIGEHFGFCRERSRQILMRAERSMRVKASKLARKPSPHLSESSMSYRSAA